VHCCTIRFPSVGFDAEQMEVENGGYDLQGIWQTLPLASLQSLSLSSPRTRPSRRSCHFDVAEEYEISLKTRSKHLANWAWGAMSLKHAV
jgi:hypothetical protein